MTTIEELFRNDPFEVEFPKAEVNPLVDDDLLVESQILDIKFDVLRSVAAVIFELRSALQLDKGDVGVLVLRGVTDLRWSSSLPKVKLTAWTIGESAVVTHSGNIVIKLGVWPGPRTELVMVAEEAVFYVGDVIGFDRIPDYVDDDDATVRAQLPSWESELEVIHAAFPNRSR